MPPDHAPIQNAQPGKRDVGHGNHTEQQRLGNYIVSHEIGRGSFATVYKGYRVVSTIESSIESVR
jgi:serine/threonine-protein kinase ULK/ATG1